MKNLTRVLLPVLLLPAGLLFAACETLPPVDVPFEGTATVPGCPVADCTGVEIPALPSMPGVSDFNLKDSPEFKSAGGVIDQIDEMHLADLTLDISSGADNFAWMTKMTFFATSTDGSLPEIEIASLTLGAGEKGSSSISLTASNADISEYVKAGNLLITAKPVGQPPPADTELKIAGTFSVTLATGL